MTDLDDDHVELSNLNRQILFTEADIGRSKVKVAREALRARYSEIEIDAVPQRIESSQDLASHMPTTTTLVVCTGDWPPHELPRWVNQACVDAGTPWIGAGQFPPRLRVGPLIIPGQTACLECLETEVRAGFPLFDEISRWRARKSTPDSSVGPVTALIGSLIAAEAMHFIVRSFEPSSVGTALLVDCQAMQVTRDLVKRDPECRICGGIA